MAMEHLFTPKIKEILTEHFGKNCEEIFDKVSFYSI